MSSSNNNNRKYIPWEQQHISSVRVIGIVREVIPISFREIHFVVDCNPAVVKNNGNNTNTDGSSEDNKTLTSPTSPNSAAKPTSSRNWVDVHATGTWAARCGLLVVGDRVELQHFGVFRPITSQLISEHLMKQRHKNEYLAETSSKRAASSNTKDSSSKKSKKGDGNNNHDGKSATSNDDSNNSSNNKTVHFWEVPEHRMVAPFVLSPVVLSSNVASDENINKNNKDTPSTTTMSTFIVERGQKLILHDEDEQRQNYDGLLIGNGNGDDGQNAEYNPQQHVGSGETNLRTQGSHTPQQLFIQSAQRGGNNNTTNNNNNKSSSSSTQITSIGNSIGKNLFSNVFRFIDVMRGLNKNLLPLLRKIQRACSGAQHVLDAGCGTGLISFAVKCADPSGAEIVATDRSRAMSALVQEKNGTFAGLINNSSSQSANNRHHSSSNNNSSAAPLVQFVLGDLTASPDRFIILPAGASATEVAVEGRKQFDVMLCIDVLSYLPSVEAMKRALFNLALHAKPKAKLLLSVPNLLACANDATKLSANSSVSSSSSSTGNTNNNTNENSNKSGNDDSSNNMTNNNGANDDAEQRPKIQRSLHFEYDRHKLSLGSSSFLSQGGVLDVIERQYYDMLTLGSNNSTTTKSDHESFSSPVSSTTAKSSGGKTTTAQQQQQTKKLLRRYTEWFGFSCPNAQSFATYFQQQQQKQSQHNNSNQKDSSSSFQPNSNTGAGTPQIFYESLEELILHPTLLETLFDDMGWKVEEVWLFNALERGGEFADAGINTLAVLGGVPGGSSTNGLGTASYFKNNNQQQNNSEPKSTLLPSPHSSGTPSKMPKVGFDDEATSNQNQSNFDKMKSAQEIEASFTHRLYTLVRKT